MLDRHGYVDRHSSVSIGRLRFCDGQDMQALETRLKVYEGALSAKVNGGMVG